MQFVHQPLVWGFLLVLLPLLIHLINMMRHRRIQWAAMDFLLTSYRKHRRWVWLKQLMLLLLRMLAVAAAVAMLAQLVSQDRWSLLFGQRTTHHFVLLDDSLSMADRSGSGSAFDRGRQAIATLTSEAANSDHQQLITLVRYSQASRSQPAGADQLTAADLNAAVINGPLESLLERQGRSLQVSQLAVDAMPALNLVEQLMRESSQQHCVLHLVSDFRSAEWNESAEIRETLQRMAKLGAEVNLIRCVDAQGENLAIESLRPAVGTLAAGVPLFMNVTVRNQSAVPAERVRLRIQSIVYPTSAVGTESAAQSSELPDILIDRIEPSETATRRFQVFFPTAGHHVVKVQLASDALEGDNRRWAVVKLDEAESALIIDGDPEERSAYYLESVFRPGSKAKTGITPSIQPLSYLRDANLEELLRHRAIYLLDVPPLDDRTLSHLTSFVEAGGGLACFLGPNANASFYSNWYDAGIFPAPIGLPVAHAAPVDTATAEIQFGDHPIFSMFAEQRNPFASAIRIRRYIPTPSRWRPAEDSRVQTLATLSLGQPLVLERNVGAGRVVAFLTTLDPEWNNWCIQPSFVVVALQLHAYLAQSSSPPADRKVGDELTVQLDARQYQPELTFVTPTDQLEVTREFVKVADQGGRTDSMLLSAELGPGEDGASETDYSGVYDVQYQTIEGRVEHQRFALNVDTRESDLDNLNSVQLRQALEPLPINVYEADQRIVSASDSDRNSWSQLLCWLLLGILLFEQWFAYRLSYHPHAMEPSGGIA